MEVMILYQRKAKLFFFSKGIGFIGQPVLEAGGVKAQSLFEAHQHLAHDSQDGSQIGGISSKPFLFTNLRP